MNALQTTLGYLFREPASTETARQLWLVAGRVMLTVEVWEFSCARGEDNCFILAPALSSRSIFSLKIIWN